MKKRIYSKEFKTEAVRFSYQRDNIKALADELRMAPARIYKWRQDLQLVTHSKSLIVGEKKSDKVKRLERALKDKELEILKKAVHIFSKSVGKSTSL